MRPADQRKPWDGMPQGYWDNVPAFADISYEARGFLEAACNVRYFDQMTHVRGQRAADDWSYYCALNEAAMRQEE